MVTIHNAKRLLSSKFTENLHYKVSSLRTEEQTRGGHNKQNILLTIPAFKKFCLMANTAKSDEIHDYYIKLEKCLHQFLEHQLRQKDEQLRSYIQQANEHKLLLDNALERPYQPVLREQTLYVAQHESEKHTSRLWSQSGHKRVTHLAAHCVIVCEATM
jgi:phage anti-repressor protein